MEEIEPAPPGRSELSTTERVSLAVQLVQERPMTTQFLAERLEMTRSGAWKLMMRLCRNAPITYADGAWHWIRM